MERDILDQALAQVRSHLEEAYLAGVIAVLEALRSPDRADVFAELPPHIQELLLPKLETETSADILEELPKEQAAEIAARLETEALAPIVDEMEPDEAADLLGDLPEPQVQELEQTMETFTEVSPLLIHPDESAGGLMTSEFLALREGMTVGEALKAIRSYPPAPQTSQYFYLVDGEQRLQGEVSLVSLVLAPPSTHLSEIMNRELISVNVGVDQEECARLLTRYGLSALPVIDSANRLLGVITADDLLEVLEKETTEDIAIMSGITPVHSLADASATSMVRVRLPWLMIGLAGGIFSAFISRFFEHTLSTYIVLAMFIPVMVYMSDASGTQTESIVVRAMALEPRLNIGRYLLREIRIALVLATIISALLSLAACLGWGSWSLGVIVGSSMFLSMTLVVFLTANIAFLFRRMNIDPALATGPLATIISDLTTLAIYFGVATVILEVIS